jgi:hypothetical protein
MIATLLAKDISYSILQEHSDRAIFVNRLASTASTVYSRSPLSISEIAAKMSKEAATGSCTQGIIIGAGPGKQRQSLSSYRIALMVLDCRLRRSAGCERQAASGNPEQ